MQPGTMVHDLTKSIFFRSALQISMSDGLAKPDQLVPASAAASSGQSAEMDKMYSGLGLDSFAGSKKDTAGSLATGLMDSDKSKKLAPMTSMTSSPGLFLNTT